MAYLELKDQVALIRRFVPFRIMSDKMVIVLSRKMSLYSMSAGETLFKIGDNDDTDYFLVSGKVEATANDGKSFTIEAKTPRAQRALANLRPRIYQVNTLEECWFMALPHAAVKELEKQHNNQLDHHDSQVISGPIKAEDVITELKEDITHDRLMLPSIPAIALKIKNAVEDPEADINTIAQIAALDPAISAKLIEAANSAVFRGVTEVSTVQTAISRLGEDITRQLVLIFAVRELFHSDCQHTVKHLENLWHDSVEVAAISHVLAKKSAKQYDSQLALTAGLFHRIGEVPVYSYSAKYPQIAQDSATVRKIAQTISRELGENIVKRWHLNPVFAEVIREQGHWMKKAGNKELDYPDLIIVAQLHSLIHKGLADKLPKLTEVGAFSRIQVGELTPELSINVLEEAEDEVESVKKLLTR